MAKSVRAPAQPHLLRGWGRQIGLKLVDQFGYNHLTAARRHPWDQHDGVELILVVDGEVQWELDDGRTYTMVGGQLSVMPPGTRHRARGDVYAPCTMFWVMYRPFTARNLANSVFTSADLPTIRNLCGETTSLYDSSARLLDACSAFRRLLQAGKSRAANDLERCELRALLCGITTEACRIVGTASARKTSVFIVKAKEYFERNLDESFLIEDAIRHIGFSRSRFYEMFKAETGLTPNDYVQRLRVNRACDPLAASGESITSIAYRMGFSDSQYFARVFRKYMGETPSAYRQRATGVAHP